MTAAKHHLRSFVYTLAVVYHLLHFESPTLTSCTHTHTQDQATATRLAELLSSLLQWVARQPRPLTICAAVSAAAALPASLRAAGCLDCEVKVPALGQQGRAALLLAGFKDKGLGFSGGLQGLEALAGKELEGFGAKDLQLVVDRAVHSALQRHMNTAAAGKAAAAAEVRHAGRKASKGGCRMRCGARAHAPSCAAATALMPGHSATSPASITCTPSRCA